MSLEQFLHRPIISIDVETGGTDPWRSALTQIGAAHIVGGKVIDTFHTIIKPYAGKSYDLAALAVQGKTYAQLEREGVPLEQAVNQVALWYLDRKENSTVWAHREYFDRKFIKAAFDGGINPFPKQWHCTMDYFGKLYARGVHDINPEVLHLADLARIYNVPEYVAHDPVDDAKTCGLIAVAMMKSEMEWARR